MRNLEKVEERNKGEFK